MAPDTSPPGGATRYIQTTRGLLSYSQLELPPVDLVPTDPAGEVAYRAALRAGDSLDWHPLMEIWQRRFGQFSESVV